MGVCAYLIVSQLLLHQIYNMYIVLGLHAWMTLFWIVDLGLVANVARTWSGSCYRWDGYPCYVDAYLYSSNAESNETTTREAYYGALAAGAFFAAVEFGLFVCAIIIHVMFMNKHRSAAAVASSQPSHPPPQYVDSSHNQPAAVPTEKYNQPQSVQPVQPVQPAQTYQQPQQSYSAVSSPQPSFAQPVQGYNTPPVPTPVTYQHEPVGRSDTVSPISHAAYTGHAAELNTPQHTGNFNPNVSELSTTQHAGNFNPNVSELSTTHEPYYNPNVSELSSR